MSMLTAQEARLLANQNSNGFKKVLEVLQEIQEAAEKGKYGTFYFFNDYYEVVYATKKLKEYGYSANYTKADDGEGYVMHIWW